MAVWRWHSSVSSRSAWRRCSSAGRDGSRRGRKRSTIWPGQKVRAPSGASNDQPQRGVGNSITSTGRGRVTYQHILYEVNEKIATITLNRPDRMNAWTPIMERDVRHAMEAAATDDNIRVIVLTGSGRAVWGGAELVGAEGSRS